MNTIAAQEIKRRGMAAVDSMVGRGPVFVLKRNQPAYVIMREQQYDQMLEDLDDAYGRRVAESLEDLQAGRVRTFKDAKALLRAVKKGAS